MQVALGLGEAWVAEALGLAAAEVGAAEGPPPVALGRGEVRTADRDADAVADAEADADGLAECFFDRWCAEAEAVGSAVALVPVGT